MKSNNSKNGSASGVNASKNTSSQPDTPMPHERDTSIEPNAPRPREKIRQAAEDLKQGQVDTDQRGERGIDQAVNPENVIETPKSPHDRADSAKK